MNKLFSLLVTITFLLSCTKKSKIDLVEKGEVQKGIPSFESLFNFITNTDVEGTFMLQSSTPLGQTDFSKLPAPINVNGTFFSGRGSKEKKGGGEIKFENISIDCKNDSYDKDLTFTDGKDLFGKQITVSLRKPVPDAPTTGSSYILPPSVYQSNYIPQLLICTTPFEENVYDAAGNYISGTKIVPGFQLTWNPDPKNEKGVFIFFEYDPNDPANQQLKNSFPAKAANGVLVNDNGYYNIAADMFTDIPLNAKIDVYIGRGNFQYLENSDGTAEVQFTEISYQYGHLWYKRPQ